MCCSMHVLSVCVYIFIDPIIQSCTFVWEICPEHWINDDMEFLERYLN